MRSFGARTVRLVARSRRAQVVLALAAVGLGMLAALAIAGVPGNDGVIHGCLATDAASGAPASAANVRVIDPSAGQHCNTTVGVGGEETLDWNTAGPQGAQGPSGPAGADGHSATVVVNPGGDAATLTLVPGSGATISAPILSAGVTYAGHGSAAAGSATRDKPATEVDVTKLLDAASPGLASAAVSGKVFKTGTVVIYAPNTTNPGTTFKLKNVLIASVHQGVTGGGQKPTETLTLVAGSIGVVTGSGGGALPAVQKGIVGVSAHMLTVTKRGR